VRPTRDSWKTALRVAIGLLLLLWIVHSIFVNEARTLARQGSLFDTQGRLVNWDGLPRLDQWRHGWTHGPPALAANLASVDAWAFASASALMGLMLYLGAARWRIALRVQGLDLPFGKVVQLSLVAHFFNAFLLGTVGGDVAKAYYAARETHHKKTETVLTVFADRVIGLWAMLLFGGLMVLPNYPLLLRPGLRTAVAFLLCMMAGATLFVGLAFRGGVSQAWKGARHWLRRLPRGEWLERTLESCRQFGRGRGFVWRSLAVSMLINVLVLLQFHVLAIGLHLHVSFLALGLVVPIVICVAALPIAPSGLGVRENLFVQLLAAPAIGVHATPALSLSLLAYAASLLWSLIGGLAYLTLKERTRFKDLATEE
jgi:glycosyltransferase 2 family protein